MTVQSKTALMQLIAAGMGLETFVHETKGEFNVTAMRLRGQAGGIPLYQVPLSQIVDWLATTRVSEPARVQDLTADSYMHDPGIFVDYGDTQLMIDGTHRALRRAQEGMGYMEFWFFQPSQIIRPPTVLQKAAYRADWGDKVVAGGNIRQRMPGERG